MKFLQFNSLRTKFFLICFMLLIIPSLVIGIVGYQDSKKELSESGKDQLKNSVRLTIGMINTLDQEVKAGHLSLEEAQERIRVEILGPKGEDNRRTINEKYIIGETGYLYAVNKDAVSVMNPTNEGTDLTGVKTPDGVMMGETIVELGLNGGGFYSYIWDNPLTGKQETKISYVEMDSNWGWIVGSGSYISEFNQGANDVLQILLLTLAISLVVGTIIVWIFINSTTKPIIAMASHVEKVSNGDLTMEPLTIKNKDEVGKLARDLNTMTVNLKELIQYVAISSEQVAASSEQLTASAQQTSKVTEHVAASTQEVEKGANAQVNTAHDAIDIVSEISKGMDQAASSIQSVADEAVSANHETSKGNAVVEQTVAQMNVVQDRVESAAKVIRELGDKSEEIEQVVALISEIAGQTNLLALNAAIEAARAGEHGQGFAVVANEVRKLADQSGKATERIYSVIGEIQSDIKSAVLAIQEGTNAVDHGMKQVQQTGESFRSITKMIEGVSAQSQEVSAIVEEVSASSHEMVHLIESVVRVSEQSAGNSKNMSIASEQQLASMEEISSSATSLAHMAEELHTLIGKFKI